MLLDFNELPEGAQIAVQTTDQGVLSGTAVSVAAGVVTAATVGAVLATANSNVKYVSLQGSDATGTGSLAQPFLTVQAAITSIGGAATAAVPFLVFVEPGTFATAFVLTPFIFVQGSGIGRTFLAPTAAQALGAGFAGAGTKLSGIIDATITTNLVANFAAIVSTGAGQVFFQNLDPRGSIVLTGATATSNALLIDVVWQVFSGFGKNLTITEMGNVDMIGVSGGFGNLVITGTDAYAKSVQAAGCFNFGGLTIAWTGATATNFLDCSFDAQPCLATPAVSGLGAIYYCPSGWVFYNVSANTDVQFDVFTGAGAAGSKIACEAGVTNMSVNAAGDITITFRRAANGSRVTVKNQSQFNVFFTFAGAVSFQGSPSYVGPLGYCEMVFQGAVWFVENQTQSGSVQLAPGTGISAFIACDLSGSSKIVATLQTFGGVAGVIAALPGDRVNGSKAGGGGFKLTSVSQATGAVVTTDAGVYEWHVTPGRA